MDIGETISRVFATASTRHSHLIQLLSSSLPSSSISPSIPDPCPQTLSFFTDIKSTLSHLRREITEQATIVKELQRKNVEISASAEAQKQETAAEYAHALARERESFESKLESQVKFTEDLLKDKEMKIKQIQELRGKCAELETKHAQIVAKLKEKHTQEMKKAKEQWAAAENTRYLLHRKAIWGKERDRQAKEMTARGLEPHLIRLYADHQAALEEAKQMYQRQLSEAIENSDRDLKRLQASLSDQLSSLNDDHQKEIRRVTDYWKERLEQTQTDNMREKDALRKQLTDAYSGQITDLEREIHALKSHQHDIAAEISAKCERDKESWLQTRLETLSEQLRRERAEIHSQAELTSRVELDAVIQKLAQEQATLVSRLESQYEQQLQHLRSQIQPGELTDLRTSLPALPGDSGRKKGKGKHTAPTLSTDTPTLKAKTGKKD